METIEGFKIVKLKFSATSKICSQLFWKPHNVREINIRKPSDRTLFILNIPSYITKNSLQNIMQRFGKVEEVFIHKKPTSSVSPEPKFPLLNPDEPVKGYKVGYVVYKEPVAVKMAMNHSSDNPIFASTEDKPIITGMKKWHAEYNSRFVSAKALHKEAEAIMEDYDERKVREKEAQSQEPDEEGWITVSHKRKKRKHPAPVQDKNTRGPKRKRRKKTKLLNFYTFQQKETNMKHLEERRKKFEEDGKRMSMLRKSRKFKPL